MLIILCHNHWNQFRWATISYPKVVGNYLIECNSFLGGGAKFEVILFFCNHSVFLVAFLYQIFSGQKIGVTFFFFFFIHPLLHRPLFPIFKFNTFLEYLQHFSFIVVFQKVARISVKVVLDSFIVTYFH